jgi:hypothetical protein
MADVPGGTVLKAEDGTTYFIRDEILEQCKVEGEYLTKLDEALAAGGDGEVEGFAFNFSSPAIQSSSLTRIQSPGLAQGFNNQALDLNKIKDLGNNMSTVMCPW